MMAPAPSGGLLTFTAKVQFVPQPAVAPEVTPFTVSAARVGAPVAATTAVIVNTQSFPESRHSFVLVPNVEGFPASVLKPALSVALNLNSLFPTSASSKVTGKLNSCLVQLTHSCEIPSCSQVPPIVLVNK